MHRTFLVERNRDNTKTISVYIEIFVVGKSLRISRVSLHSGKIKTVNFSGNWSKNEARYVFSKIKTGKISWTQLFHDFAK